MEKKKVFLTVLAVTLCLVVACCLVACDNRDDEPPFEPWDNLDGGQTGQDINGYSDTATNDYLSTAVSNYSFGSDTFDTTATDCYFIDLTSLPSADLTSVTAYSYKKNELKIVSNGTFVLSGMLNGAISVGDTDGEVRIVLNGVEITTTQSQSSAAIVFKKPTSDTVAPRVLTVYSGTINKISDSTGDTALDGDGAVIQAKKRSLTINGSGTLELTCIGEEASGIKAKTSLAIYGTTVKVTGANKSGIKADELVILKDSTVCVSAKGDGIKTDIEPDSVEEAREYASNIDYGYIYIENSSLDIISGDDGISANSCLFINNSENNVIRIAANNGAPQTVTEASSDSADGKALKVGGIEFDDTDYPSTDTNNYALVILGGTFEINSNDDALHSKGNLLVTGGTLNIATGDDGLHAEYLTKIVLGNITVTKSYEGIEGATVEILGGTIDITSTDDGINAANSDFGRNYAFYILITGGKITVDAQGDGLDSNGTIKITGGDITIYGPTQNDNGALDADTGILVNGGNLIAVGAAGMVETPSGNSTQCYISLTLSSAVQAGTAITVKDSNGNVLIAVAPDKRYQSVIVSHSSFVQGETYTVTVGEENYSATLEKIGTALGRDMHDFGNQGFRPGMR